MKFVTVRDFRSRPAKVWKDLNKEHEMIVTSNGKPVALMTPVSEKTIGTTLATLKRLKAIEAVNSMQLKSLEAGNNKMTDAQINSIIGKVRNKRVT